MVRPLRPANTTPPPQTEVEETWFRARRTNRHRVRPQSGTQVFTVEHTGKHIRVCRVATGEFEPVPSAVSAARRWIADYLGRWELQELTGTAVLLTSELVTNAVVHATSRPVVSMAVADGILEVGVSDRDPRLPHPAGSGSPGSKTLDGPAFMAGGARTVPCRRPRRRVGRNPSRPRQASVVPPRCDQLVISDRLPLPHGQRRPRPTRIGTLRARYLWPMGPPDCPRSQLNRLVVRWTLSTSCNPILSPVRGLLLRRRRPRQRNLLRRPSHRTQAPPPHHGGLRHERAAPIVRPRHPALAPQRSRGVPYSPQPFRGSVFRRKEG